MDIYLKRYFWVVPILVIMCCGVLAAKAANHLLEAKVLGGNGQSSKRASARPRPKVEAQKPPPSKDATEVIHRNMFCSSCEPPAAASTTPGVVVDENHPPITSLPLALAATIVSQNPAASAATILNTQSGKSGQYSVGDHIPDVGDVRKIRPKFVDFYNKSLGRLERVELGGTASPAVASAPPPPMMPPQNPVPGTEAGNPEADLLAAVDKGVRKVNDNQYDIDRSLVDKILADPSVMMRQARVVPSIKDGKANGFKMYAIRPSSVYAKIGLQNGDTIQAINGFEITSMDKAMEIYTKLRSASNLSLSVMRRGQQVQMDYSIK